MNTKLPTMKSTTMKSTTMNITPIKIPSMAYLFSLTLLVCGLANATEPAQVFDGPYLTHLQAPANHQVGTAQLQAAWVCAGKAIVQQQPLSAPVLPRCGYDKPIQVANATAAGWQFQSSRFAAISDIHGQYDLMLRLLQASGVINAAQQWSFGHNQLVIVGDVMDRGNKVTEALWFLYSLQQQAKQAGGAVHVLPGNHETMVLRGDLRYVHDDYQHVATQLNTSLDSLYGSGTVLGDWLRQLPLFVRINDTLFVHGGISATLSEQQLHPTELLNSFQQSWGLSKADLATQPLLQLLQTSPGPLWYRGYFPKKGDVDQKALQQQLQPFGAARIVVGHTSMDDVYRHHQGLVYSVDSSIKNGKTGSMLHFIDGKWFKSGLDGKLVPVTDAPKKPRQDKS